MTGAYGRRTRRAFLASAGAAATLTAGCLGSVTTGSPDTLRVGTYQAFVDAPSTSAGAWVKEEFERRTDYSLEWVVPENELTGFIQRRQEGIPLEADAFLGITPPDLVRAEANLDEPLFGSFDADAVSNAANIDEAYRFDPKQRVLPTGASYVCIVYDESAIDPPESFEALTEPAYADSLLLANPQNTVTGLLFLLWSIHATGPDQYLEYWKRLMDNDVHVLGSWSDAYAAYSNAEASMVVSYSTDQVYAASADEDMARHQIAFLEDQGYAYVDGIGPFATTERRELVAEFANFLLEPDVQQTTAVKNVGIPTVTNASLPEDVRQYAHVPENPVQFDAETLAANMKEWRDAWAKQVASK